MLSWLVFLLVSVTVFGERPGDDLSSLQYLDIDGDGKVSNLEASGSPLFKETDANGDGTINAAEVVHYLERNGAKEVIFKGDAVLLGQSALDAVARLDLNTNGVQGSELVRNWDTLAQLATTNEVADWVSHAVLLPQYADTFRANGIKGFDLPLLLESPELLKDLGVFSELHRRQIARAISLRLLGFGQMPTSPSLQCVLEDHDPGSAVISIRAKWLCDDVTEKRCGSLPIQKWHVSGRLHEEDPWISLNSFEGHQFAGNVQLPKPYGSVLPHPFVELRITAWNIIGRSEHSFARCGISLPSGTPPKSIVGAQEHERSLPVKKETSSPMKEASGASANDGIQKYDTCSFDLDKIATSSDYVDVSHLAAGTINMFRAADLDGDGAVAEEELHNLISGLSDVSSEDVVRDKSYLAQTEYLDKKGADFGILSVDNDKDRSILPSELEGHWKSLSSLMTVDRTANWLTHAVELPQYVPVFKMNGITGFDLPRFAEDDGAALEKRLGVSDPNHRHLLVRAITVMVMGIGKPPASIGYVDAREGEKCGTIKLDWSAAASNALGKDAMPIHKYRVLRRRKDQTGGESYEEVYTGMSTTFVDTELSQKIEYIYRVEAWNLLGVSPATETMPLRANSQACLNPWRMLYNTLWYSIFLPFHALGILADNYYRITAFFSVVGFGIMFNNVPYSEKLRVIGSLRQRVIPALKKMIGSSLGLEFVLGHLIMWLRKRHDDADMISDEEEDSILENTKSPHQALISRAVEATFPSRQVGHNGILQAAKKAKGRLKPSEPSRHNVVHRETLSKWDFVRNAFNPHHISSHPSTETTVEHQPSSERTENDISKWNVVRRELMKRRVVNTWRRTLHETPQSSDTECSSHLSLERGDSPRRKPSKRFRDTLRRLKRSSQWNVVKEQDVTSCSEPALKTSLTMGDEVRGSGELLPLKPSLDIYTGRNCALCSVVVTKYNRHICGRCHLPFCEKHTAYASHMKFFSCGVESKCICINCSRSVEPK